MKAEHCCVCSQDTIDPCWHAPETHRRCAAHIAPGIGITTLDAELGKIRDEVLCKAATGQPWEVRVLLQGRGGGKVSATIGSASGPDIKGLRRTG